MHAGKNIFLEATGVDGTGIFGYSRDIGLGSTGYDLVNLD
jgi:uncharacterized Fe-S center protein